jgi:hypothetical protein
LYQAVSFEKKNFFSSFSHGKPMLIYNSHHTRFFPEEETKVGLGNVPPCTVIPNCKGSNDIFLVSQAAIIGTCRPTHYVTVLDEKGLSFDDYTRMILSGCFNYQRATRSVSLHSAVYYADQCCERAKCHLTENDSEGWGFEDVQKNLRSTMWWQ